MLSPLIPDIKHPKWIIAIKILEIIASPRAEKIAARLKISDIDNFLFSIKLLVLSDLFERDVTSIIYEYDSNLPLKSLLKVNSEIKPQSIYRLYSKLDYAVIHQFFKRLFSISIGSVRILKNINTLLIIHEDITSDLSLF